MNLSLKSIFSFGWQKTKKNLLKLIGFAFVLFISSLFIGILGDDILSFGGILSILISPIFYFVLAKVSLGFINSDKIDWKNLFKDFSQKTYTAFLMVYLVNAVALTSLAYLFLGLSLFSPLLSGLISFILYISLAVYFMGVIMFTYYRLIEEKPDFWLAIKESFKMANGRRWFLVKFILLAILINLVGLLFLGVGLLVTMPITFISLAKLYKEIKQS
jgi:hypothetical protein